MGAAIGTVILVLGLVVAWLIPQVSAEAVNIAKLVPSKAPNTFFLKGSSYVQRWAVRDVRFTLFQGGTSYPNVASVGGLKDHPEAAFHINQKGDLYVNGLLKLKLQEVGQPVKVGLDVKETCREWARPLIPLTLILAFVWGLGFFKPQGLSLQSPSGTNRLPALDSLRGLASLFVLFNHAVFTFYPPQWFAITYQNGVLERTPAVMEWLKFSPLKLFLNGQLMVIIFWILSGLVLSMPILAKDSYAKIAQAATKRYFRLMPVAAFTVLMTYFLLVTDSFWHGAFAEESGYLVPSMVNTFPGQPELLHALKDAFGFGTSFNAPLWTISLEFQGSLLLFAVIACSMSLHHRRLVWLVVVLYLIFITQNYYFADFILGLFLADYLVRRAHAGKAAESLSRKWLFVLLALGIAAGSAYPGWANLWFKHSSTHEIGWHVHLSALCFVCLATFSAPVVRLLSARPLVWIGERSFALYAVHAMLIYLVGHAAAVILIRWGLSPEWSSLIAIGVYLVVTLVVSDFLLRFVDRPSIVLAQKVGTLLQGQKTFSGKTASLSRDRNREEMLLPSSGPP